LEESESKINIPLHNCTKYVQNTDGGRQCAWKALKYFIRVALPK
jgi:hypothetical protein